MKSFSFKNAVVLTFFGLIIGFSMPKVFAQYGEQPPPPSQPGVGIEINKLVSIPGNDAAFVDNLSASDPRFRPGDGLFFKFIVKNILDTKLINVQVDDFLPPSVFMAEGESSFNAGDFDPGESKEFVIKVQVKNQDQLPADRGVFCEVNTVRASGNGVSDQDTAQFCIEKQVAGVPGAPGQPPVEVPQAGPGMGLILLGANLGLLSTGIYLRRRK